MEKNTTLVPIRVGMILSAVFSICTNSPCPHTRGDDPHDNSIVTMLYALSPYAWG